MAWNWNEAPSKAADAEAYDGRRFKDLEVDEQAWLRILVRQGYGTFSEGRFHRKDKRED